MSRKTPFPINISASEIEKLVQPMLLRSLPVCAYEQIGQYTQLLYRWNARMNLTAVADPVEWIRLHVAESLRCAQLIPTGVSTVLDFGSGAGLPGIPIQIAVPDLTVTQAESQGKKAAFLREALRTLDLAPASVFAGRVEDMPPESSFDLVALRAVDDMGVALTAASKRICTGGWCMVLTSMREQENVLATLSHLQWLPSNPIPGTAQRIVLFGQVPN